MGNTVSDIFAVFMRPHGNCNKLFGWSLRTIKWLLPLTAEKLRIQHRGEHPLYSLHAALHGTKEI